VEVSANKGWTNAVLATFLGEQGLYDQAIEAYLAAIDYNPREALYFAHLGGLYLERLQSPNADSRDAERAKEAFANALEGPLADDYSIAFVLAQRGQLYGYLQQFDRAIADLEQAHELAPDSPYILLVLARNYATAGQVQQACEAYQGVLGAEMQAPYELVVDARQGFKASCTR
jgi:tetratricopeptide (TPR) repeat protein